MLQLVSIDGRTEAERIARIAVVARVERCHRGLHQLNIILGKHDDRVQVGRVGLARDTSMANAFESNQRCGWRRGWGRASG